MVTPKDASRPRVWIVSALITVALHLGAVIGTLALKPFDSEPLPIPDPEVIDVVFAKDARDEPNFFTELPDDKADEAPDDPDFLSNVDSRARDDVPGGSAESQPRQEGQSEAPQVAMTPAGSPEVPPGEPEPPAAEETVADTKETRDQPIASLLQRQRIAAEQDRLKSFRPEGGAQQSRPAPPGAGDSDIHQEATNNPDGNVDLSGGISLNTVAWDYAPWLQAFRRAVDERWQAPVGYSLGLIHGWTLVELEIDPSGELKRLTVLEEEGHQALRQASVHALEAAAPYRPLPREFPEDHLLLRIRMYYPGH